MKKFLSSFCLLVIAITTPAVASGNSFPSYRVKHTTSAKANKTDATYNSIRQQYSTGKISADSVVNLALYHKAGNISLAESCLKLVADKSQRGAMELGVLYAFSPEYAKHAADGVKLLQNAAKAGNDDANCYLGFYYFTHQDYNKAKSYFDAARPIKYGFGYTALGSMYTMGKGVKENMTQARENFHQGALKGYPRGMALYGFNLRTKSGGPIDYPNSFFWLYIAGDLGDDTARTTLFLPRRNENRGDSETAQKAMTALEMIEAAQSGKKIQNEPIYREGFLRGLKACEKAAEQGDDWARFYLGSMNYNGDFLNQNYTQVLHYYEPIVKSGKLPANVLALVHERLANIYRNGKGVKADSSKATQHTRMAAKYGSLSAYKQTEGIN